MTKKQTSQKRKNQTAKTPTAPKAPKEWQAGKIVLPPAAARLKGAGNVRKNGADFPDIKRTTYQWFLQHLADDQKVQVSNYGGAGGWFMSPEAGKLLVRSKAFWTHLAQAEVSAAKTHQAAELSLVAGTAPAEFVGGRVVMSKPAKPVSAVFCWKPDFDGENYKSVLWYRDLLPDNHCGTTRDEKGYEAKTMSPDAAALYRKHRDFWVAKYWEPIKAKQADDEARKSAGKQTVEKAASKSGLSKVDFQAKLQRLALMVKEGNLQLVAEMIASFEDAWLFESLLAGSSINEKGCLAPGKMLKGFKAHAQAVGFLAWAYAPTGTEMDASLREKNKPLQHGIEFTEENLETLAALLSKYIYPHFPQLALVSKGTLRLDGLTKLSDAAAESLSKLKGDLCLSGLKQLSDAVAESLSKHEGDLELQGAKNLSNAAVDSLSKHKGALGLGGLTKLSDAVTESLRKHEGDLTLWGMRELSDAAAESLSKHKGGINFARLTKLSDAAAESLSKLKGDLMFFELRQLSDIAVDSLSKHKGVLGLRHPKLSDATAESLSKHVGHLDLSSLEELSDAAAESLSKHKGGINFGSLEELSDAAAKSLSKYEGDLEFYFPRASARIAKFKKKA